AAIVLVVCLTFFLLLVAEGPVLLHWDLGGRGGKSSQAGRGAGGHARRHASRSGGPCSCRHRPVGWSGGCHSHRPGEPARPWPCRRASGYRTEACPCVRRNVPCRSCNTTG